MTDLYTLGIAPLFMMGIVALYVSFGPINWCIYGRATLAYLGAFLILASMNRFFVAIDMTSVETSLAVNSLFAFIFMVIILNLVIVHVYIHWREIVRSVTHRKGFH